MLLYPPAEFALHIAATFSINSVIGILSVSRLHDVLNMLHYYIFPSFLHKAASMNKLT